jgi:hypothetical protein
MRDTIDMAREAGWKDLRDYDSEMRHDFFMGNTDSLKALVDLARADEREACAKTKAGKPRELKAIGRGSLLGEQQFCFEKGWREGAASVRAAIRERGNT